MVADWAVIFDHLSILWTKQVKIGGQESQLAELTSHIAGQIGYDFYWRVFESTEYKAVYQANIALFDGVELVRHSDGMKIKDFDELNQARHRAKQALQKKFWGAELTEAKT
jgi:hypothetical protein